MRLLAMLLVALLPLTAGATPVIAIIMDDLGYSRANGERALNLPVEVTAAVIPKAPHGPTLAKKAAEGGREVIVHLPMTAGPTWQLLDPGGIHDDMPAEEIGRVIRDAFERIPQASGLNNHMGSRFTANREAMHWVMHELATHRAFFVDSLTTADSAGMEMAARHGLPAASRDVFLDNERGLLDINKQFNTLLRIARQRGHAVGIAHPYPETLDYLEEALPLLADAGVELVPISSLLSEPEPQQFPPARAAQRPDRREESTAFD